MIPNRPLHRSGMKTTRGLILLIIVATLLSACQASPITELLTKPGSVLFQDDFSTATGDWTRLSSPQGYMDYYSTAFRIWVNLPDYDYWSLPGLNFGNVHLEVEAARLAGPDENRYGLICRYQDSQNFYFFILSSDGYFAIGKEQAGVRTLLGQEMMSYSPAIHLGIAPNHLHADCINDTLLFYINDQPVALACDPDFTSGDVGLIAGAFDQTGVDILFDDFIVYKP